MGERENENHQPLVVDMHDDTIVSHSVPPKPFETSRQRFAALSRVIEGGEFLQIARDAIGLFASNLAEGAARAVVELNWPTRFVEN